MSHIDEGIHIIYLYHVGFVMNEILVCFDGSRYLLQVVSRKQFYVNHATMYTRSERNGHRKCGLDTVYDFYGYGVPHAHARTEVRVGDPFGYDSLHQCAHYRVAAGIPARSDDGCRPTFPGGVSQRSTQGQNTVVDVETVSSAYSLFQYLQGCSLYFTTW